MLGPALSGQDIGEHNNDPFLSHLFSVDRTGTDPLPLTSALAELPTFTPTAGVSTGLDLLAAAASAPSWGHHTSGRDEARPTAGEIGLNRPGPFNPTATLTPKVAITILEPEYVEMSEVTMDTPSRA